MYLPFLLHHVGACRVDTCATRNCGSGATCVQDDFTCQARCGMFI